MVELTRIQISRYWLVRSYEPWLRTLADAGSPIPSVVSDIDWVPSVYREVSAVITELAPTVQCARTAVEPMSCIGVAWGVAGGPCKTGGTSGAGAGGVLDGGAGGGALTANDCGASESCSVGILKLVVVDIANPEKISGSASIVEL